MKLAAIAGNSKEIKGFYSLFTSEMQRCLVSTTYFRILTLSATGRRNPVVTFPTVPT